jgi:hypothetical protein
VKNGGNNVVVPHFFAKPFKTVPAPVIQSAFALDALHIVGTARQDEMDCPDYFYGFCKHLGEKMIMKGKKSSGRMEMRLEMAGE